MKPNFALLLSFDGLRLLHRVSTGWHLVGEVALDSPDLAKALAMLRRTAIDLDPRGLRTKLLIPNEQIRYMALDTTRASEDDIVAALDGATPYAVKDLVYDYARGGGRTYIAAVARETLEEAEAFAREHKFAPVCFAAIPEEFTYVGEVFFGPTQMAASLIGPNETVEPDEEPVRVVGKALVRPPEEVAAKPAPVAEVPVSPPVETPVETPVEVPVEVPPPTILPDAAKESAAAPATHDPVLEDLGTPDIPVPEPASDPDPSPASSPASEAPESEPMFASRARPSRAAEGAPSLGGATRPQAPAPLMPTPRHDPGARIEPVFSSRIAASGERHPALRAISQTEPEETPAPVETPEPTEAAATVQPTLAVPVEVPAPVVDLSGAARRRDAPNVASLRPVTTSTEAPHVAPAVTGVSDAALPADARPRRSATVTPLRAVPPPPADGSDDAGPAVEEVEEKERLTVFGARKGQMSRKPRFLGLILTVLLLLVLLAVAAFAAVKGPEGLAQLFGFGKATTEVAATAPADTAPVPSMLDEANADLADAQAPISPAQLGVTAAPLAPDVGAISVPEAPTADAPLSLASAAPEAPVAPPADARPDVTAGLPAADPAAATPPAAAPAANGSAIAQMAAALSALGGTEPEAPQSQAPEAAAPAETAAFPPAPPGTPLSPAEAERLYAATGVWQRADRLPVTPRTESDDDVVMASIDPVSPSRDAIALPPAASLSPDQPLALPRNPPPAGVTFPRDADGNILATPEGTVTPDGIVVYAGAPPVVPPVRPGTEAATVTEVAPDTPLPVTPGGVALASFRPQERPAGLIEDAQRASLNGRTLSELAKIRPEARPGDLAPPPAAAPDNPSADVAAIAAAIAGAGPADPVAGATDLAVARSPLPETRPRNFSRVVQAAAPAPRQTAAVAPQQLVAPATNSARIPAIVPSPTGPVPGGVARAATEANVLNLRELNLIGVYGASNARMALIRTSRGQYVRVTVGDSLDGGRVVAIGENALNYVKRGRTYTLQMPPA